MAAVVPFPFKQGQLTGSAAAILTAGASQNIQIKKAVFTNTDSSARTITVYLVPAAGSPGATNVLIAAFSLTAGQAYVANELANQVISNSASVQAFASVTSVVNYAISGLSA